MKNTQKYVIIFAKDENGQDVKYRFMICLGKSIKSIEENFLKSIMGTDGVDRVEIQGRYTAEIVIARSFDADEVLAELTPKLDSALSDIITPKLHIP